MASVQEDTPQVDECLPPDFDSEGTTEFSGVEDHIPESFFSNSPFSGSSSQAEENNQPEEITEEEVTAEDYKSYLQPVKVLGIGAFGTVLLLRDKRTGDHLAEKRSAISRIRNASSEYQFMKRLSEVSPYFLKTRGFFRDRRNVMYPKCHLLMEYFESTDLKTVIRRDIIPVWEVQNVLRQLGSALVHMHSLNILHMDIKPENVLLNDNYECKLIDLGIALRGPTATGFSGTSFFAAPEVQAFMKLGRQKAPPYGFQADYYSLGMTAFLMGVHITHVDFQRQLLGLYRRAYYPWVVALQPFINPEAPCNEFMDLLDGLLQNNPAKRLNDRNFLNHPFFQRTFQKVNLDPEELRKELKAARKRWYKCDLVVTESIKIFEEEMKGRERAMRRASSILTCVMKVMESRYKLPSKKKFWWMNFQRCCKKNKKKSSGPQPGPSTPQEEQPVSSVHEKKKKFTWLRKMFQRKPKVEV